MSDGNVSLGDDEIDKLVVLRMNRQVMKFRRQYYAHRLNESFGKFEVKIAFIIAQKEII